jgi:[acyl-carrier-protein] S-malonyltransferase
MVNGERTVAFLFPGQASQRAGMAAELLEREPAARQLFDAAGRILGLDLAEVCTEGSDELLARTDITQPALLTTCLGWLAALRGRGIRCSMTAGHSLGEFGAWVAAGALDFETAIRLVRRRGELMAEAGRRRPGGMLAVVGLTDSQVVDVCQAASGAGVVAAANFNSPSQVVVSGELAALDKVSELVERQGGTTIRIRVSGAFHSPLMEDAAHVFVGLVEEAMIKDPHIPVICNATAEPVADAAAVRRAMAAQMTSPVRWTASVRRMIAEGAEILAEIGPGQVLTKLTRRISADARAMAVGSSPGLERLVEEVRV